MISFALLFAVAFAQMPTTQQECTTAGGTWTSEGKCKCANVFNRHSYKCVAACPEGVTAPTTGEKAGICECPNDKYFNGLDGKNECVAECPEKSQSLGVNLCTKCGEGDFETNKYYDAEKKECVAECPSKTAKDANNVCQKCGAKKYDPFTKTCKDACDATMEEGKDSQAGICQCKKATPHYDAITKKECVAECPEKSADEKLDDYHYYCKKCSEKPETKLYDKHTQECVNACPTGATNTDGVCACPSGQYTQFIPPASGEGQSTLGCKACAAGTTYDKNEKACVKPKNGVNGLFVLLAMTLFFLF